jgi:peptidoglycan/LPS O-acetylase OafA/YrhL
MKGRQISQRIAGLDFLRALAIVLVLVAHYPKTGAGLLTRVLNFGWSGVDLFFVLSGYLIGSQLFAAQASGRSVSLTDFYARRWLRTLPNYYVVLALYFFAPAWFSGAIPTPPWKFLTFTQNMGIPSAFTPSWSLCVEEQFYLLFPIAAILLIRTNRSRLIASVFAGILLFEILLRASIWLAVRPDRLAAADALPAYMGALYYPTWCRLDGIALGVGLAALKCFRPEIWRRLMERGNLLLASSVLLLVASIVAFWTRYSFLCSTVGFALLSWSFALLTASVLSDCSLFAGRGIPGTRALALLSYSIYLTHSLAIEMAASLAARFGVTLQSAPGIGIGVATMSICATVLYYAVERPGLAMRDRFLGTRKSRPAEMVLKPALETNS